MLYSLQQTGCGQEIMLCLMQDKEEQPGDAGSVEFQYYDEALQAIKRLTNTVDLPLLVQQQCEMAQHHITLRFYFTLDP